MSLSDKAAVIGCSIRAPITNQRESLEEILYALVQDALRDAQITIEDVDGIVVASNDQMDGRAISVMAASGSVGGVDRDILSTPSAGEHAFIMGVLRVASGHYKTQLIVSWSPTEANSIAEVERLGADPYFHRRLPLDQKASDALQVVALQSRIPQSQAAAANILARATVTNSSTSRLPWPLTEGMVAPPVTGAVALVLASPDFVMARGLRESAWVTGLGWATEPTFLGDRDLSTAPALAVAAERAYTEAGVERPADSVDVAEIDDHTPHQALLVLETLRLSGRKEWDRDSSGAVYRANGKIPVNPSGGVRAANAVFCTGLLRIAEAANQVRGCAKNQIHGIKLALAHAASGFAMQYQTVVLLAKDNRR